MLEFLTLKPEAFGLDVSDSSLKIVKLKKKDKFLSLASFGETEITPGIIKKGEIQDEEALIEMIKKALIEVKGEKIKTNYVVASLPEEEAFLEVIQMPKMKAEELKKAIYFEAENYIPLSIEEVYLDFQVVRPVYNHLNHSDVLIAVLPKKTVASYVSCLQKAGLRPQALEIESLSIARALIKNEFSPRPLLLIDFGADKTSLMIFSGYSLRFTRAIPISSREFAKAISRGLDISFREAEMLKIKFGLEKEYQLKIKDGTERKIISGKVSNIIAPLLTNLVKEIKQCLDYYPTHIRHEHLAPDSGEINKILLCGGGANLKGLPEFLSLALKMPAELGNPWTNILKTPLKEIPELSYKKSLTFTTALGLALRGINIHQ
ncbi:MAG TPA: type IV pilus assembly protein PilM [Candidatus Nealsonbacteria bacterium]|uniref:SHS2 domain-containing protein n=1 Tax=marine sediment metagenome TaxID=412755 RepID=A0A0F9XXP6_9ZZZZ|nr:type IV pilus assembly protein PilM [Candidatus Nealsonbacteria bacterium]HEB46110.1 type IV pilus assembly protein PilM [Candidatus Nealsonbacteria bacterium]